MKLPANISYFPRVISKTDLEVALNALVSDKGLINIGGLVIDIRQIENFRALLKQTSMRGNKIVAKMSDLEENKKAIIVDPMTNCLAKETVRKSLIKSDLKDELPMDFIGYVEESDKSGYDRDNLVKNCRGWAANADLAEKTVSLQNKSHASVLLQPYFTIYSQNFAEMLDLNVQFARQAMNHSKRVFKKPFGAVICIDKILLRDAVKQEHIFLKYKEIDADWYFLKIDNFNSDNKDENYEGIRKFFQLAKKTLGDNIFFLDMNEFALVLSIDHINGFSFPMYTSTAFIITRTKERPKGDGKYINPETMKRLAKRSITYLPCACYYCSPYAERRVSTIDVPLWQGLRREHWLWWMNDEINKVLKANDTGLPESLRQRFHRTIHKDWEDLI